MRGSTGKPYCLTVVRKMQAEQHNLMLKQMKDAHAHTHKQKRNTIDRRPVFFTSGRFHIIPKQTSGPRTRGGFPDVPLGRRGCGGAGVQCHGAALGAVLHRHRPWCAQCPSAPVWWAGPRRGWGWLRVPFIMGGPSFPFAWDKGAQGLVSVRVQPISRAGCPQAIGGAHHRPPPHSGLPLSVAVPQRAP